MQAVIHRAINEEAWPARHQAKKRAGHDPIKAPSRYLTKASGRQQRTPPSEHVRKLERERASKCSMSSCVVPCVLCLALASCVSPCRPVSFCVSCVVLFRPPAPSCPSARPPQKEINKQPGKRTHQTQCENQANREVPPPLVQPPPPTNSKIFHQRQQYQAQETDWA